MTTRELLTFFEMFYGEKYSGIFLETMTTYLSGYSGEFYKAAANVLVRRYSRSFGKAPGPAEFEKHKEEILATMPEPKKLPEPKPERPDKETLDTFFSNLKEHLRKLDPGPMAKVLEETLA